jgi:isopentenyldiphosphate isomerase
MTGIAQDPDELFDVVTQDGEPTGITKRRADVHRDGDWHRAVHVWVYGDDDAGPFLLMNQRGRHKDTWPLALDATVGGHLGAGETVEDAYREIEEEIGITAPSDALYFIGRRARASDGHYQGVIDREIQEIFLLRDDRPLHGYRPNAAELEGIVQVPLHHAIELFAGQVDRVRAKRLRADDLVVEDIDILYAELLILPDDDYFGQVARTVRRILDGDGTATLADAR